MSNPALATRAALAGIVTAKLPFLICLAIVAGGLPLGLLSGFDGNWYASILKQGYQWPSIAGSKLSNLAFFPLFPALAWPFSQAFGAPLGLLIVAWLGTAAAAVGIARVCLVVADRSVAFWVVLLWAVAPRSHVLVMAYAEGLFTALVAWGLWAILTKRWLLAGMLGACASLTRPAVIPFIVILGLVWLVDFMSKIRPGHPMWRSIPGPRLWAVAIAVSGFAAYWCFVAIRTGNFLGYLKVQAVWGSSLGTPLDTFSHIMKVVWPNLGNWRYGALILAALIVYIALFCWMLINKENWVLTAFSGLVILLVVSQQGYFHSKARFLLPAFPVWLPLARVLVRLQAWLRWALAAVLLTASVFWGVDTASARWSP